MFVKLKLNEMLVYSCSYTMLSCTIQIEDFVSSNFGKLDRKGKIVLPNLNFRKTQIAPQPEYMQHATESAHNHNVYLVLSSQVFRKRSAH